AASASACFCAWTARWTILAWAWRVCATSLRSDFRALLCFFVFLPPRAGVAAFLRVVAFLAMREVLRSRRCAPFVLGGAAERKRPRRHLSPRRLAGPRDCGRRRGGNGRPRLAPASRGEWATPAPARRDGAPATARRRCPPATCAAPPRRRGRARWPRGRS